MPATNERELDGLYEEAKKYRDKAYAICNAYSRATEAIRELEEATVGKSASTEFMQFWELDEIHHTYVDALDYYEAIIEQGHMARTLCRVCPTIRQQAHLNAIERQHINAGQMIEDTYGQSIAQLYEAQMTGL